MNGHTTANVGKRLYVILYNGRSFVDKLTALKSKYYVFEQEGRVRRQDIRSFSIARMKDSSTT